MSRKTSINEPTNANKTQPNPPAILDGELKHLLSQLDEHYQLTSIIEKSYVLSSFWAWLSQIETQPKIKVPVPRFLSQRDP